MSSTPKQPAPSSTDQLPEDFDKALLRGLVKKLLKMVEGDEPLSAAEITAINRVLSDNSVTFAGIRAGSFGEVARKAAEEFPFDAAGNVIAIGGSRG